MGKKDKRHCRAKILFLVLIASLAGMVSCENDFLLSDSQEESLFVETSVRSGSILPPGKEIDLTLVSEEEGPVPERLEVEVLHPDGSRAAGFTVDEPLKEALLPPVSLQEQDEGLYFLYLRLFGTDDELLHEQELPLFVSENKPVIERLETYPPSALKPDGGGVIIPRVAKVENGWARWLMDGEEIEAGPLSRYEEGFVWNAPEEEGVYSIVLEVFPFSPPEELGNRYDFSAPVSGKVQFYVQKNAPGNPLELQNEDSYLHLLHFRGNLDDGGNASVPFSFIGNPPTGTEEDFYGYQLSPGHGVEGTTSLLPPEKEGTGPFSLSLLLNVDSPGMGEDGFSEEGINIVSVTSESDDTPFMRLSIRDDGAPSFSMSGLQRRITASEIDMYRLGELTVTVIPYGSGESPSGSLEDGEAAVKWYADGELIRTFVVDYTPEEPPVDGITVIGGERGFSGLIDELGVFYRDSEGRPSGDEDVFRRNALRMIGEDDLYLAEGYENGLGAYDGRMVSSAADNTIAEVDKEWEEPTFYIRAEGPLKHGGIVFSDSEGELFTLPLREVQRGDNYSFSLEQEEEKISVSGRGDIGTLVQADRKKQGDVKLQLVRLKNAAEESAQTDESEPAQTDESEPAEEAEEDGEALEIILTQLLITRGASGLADEK
ncbi:MAG: hypothetical protein R6V67_09610 [Spirochaetia bacterium]